MVTAGIDIAKASLVAAIDGQDARFETSNDAPGWRALSRWLGAMGAERAGMEATGGYERGVAAHLVGAGFVVRVVDPAGARHFARSMGARAKNDAVDAGWIARYTASLPVEAGSRMDPRVTALSEHLRFVEQLEEDRARWKTRAESCATRRFQAQAETRARRLAREIKAQIALLEATIRREADLAERLDLLLSIRGVGLRSAIAMIVHLPELGSVSREQAAALTGVAPWDHDSGTMRGQRHIAGGRPRLRRALYNAVGLARVWNPDLKAHYQRLIDKGKHHCCAMIACVRKLIIIANAVINRGTPWQHRNAE